MIAIVGTDGSTDCTGTLVGPHTVLTAAHCQIGPDNYASYRVFFGADVAGDGTSIDLSDARVHPQFDPTTFAHDLALLTIAQAGPAQPIPIDPRVPDGSLVDQSFRAVGFGMTAAGAGDEGRKRVGTAAVSAVGDLDFTTKASPSQPCVGDSGGPALFDVQGATYITGVVSHGDTNCTDHAVYARIDVGLDTFVEPYLAETAPGTAKPGDRCLYAEQCTGSTCVGAADDSRIMYCAPSCGGGASCPAGMVCTSVDGGGQQCRYPLPTPGAMGAPCASDGDCRFGVCTEKSVCSQRCMPAGDDCPAGFACTNLSGIEFYCMAVPAPEPGETSSCSLSSVPVPRGELAYALVVYGAVAGLLAVRRPRRRG